MESLENAYVTCMSTAFITHKLEKNALQTVGMGTERLVSQLVEMGEGKVLQLVDKVWGR